MFWLADFPKLGFDVVDTERGADTLQIYLAVDEYVASEFQTVRNHFQDADAIYIMEKTLTGE